MGSEAIPSHDRVQNSPQGLSLFALQGFHSRFGEGAYPFQTAQDGRLLSEIRASERALTTATAQRTQPKERHSKLPGTRTGFAENYAAFESIAQEWQPTLDALSWLHKHYFEDSTQPATIQDLKQVSLLGIYTASFLLNKADGYGPTDELPTVVAHVLKVCKGVYTVAVYMEESSTRVANPNDIRTIAEREKLLITLDQKACPAPLPMIRSALEALLDGKGNFSTSSMNDILPGNDFERLKMYVEYAQRYTHLSTAVIDEISLLTKLPEGQRQQAYEAILQRYADELQQLQHKINVILGRYAASAPKISTEELARFEGLSVDLLNG